MSTEPVSFFVDASPKDVWRVTGEQWDEVHRLIPRISNSVLTSDGGVREGATRRCTLSEATAGMQEIDERLVFMDPPETVTYELLDPHSRFDDSPTRGPSNPPTRTPASPSHPDSNSRAGSSRPGSRDSPSDG